MLIPKGPLLRRDAGWIQALSLGDPRPGLVFSGDPGFTPTELLAECPRYRDSDLGVAEPGCCQQAEPGAP